MHVPMCKYCQSHEVQIVTDENGNGFCDEICRDDLSREILAETRMTRMAARTPRNKGP